MTTRSVRLALLSAVLIAIMLLPQAWPASSATAPLKPGLPIRSAQEVAVQWKKLMNPSGNAENPYLTSPSVSPPYAPGSLQPRYIRDGVDAVNFYRFVSGLPYDLTATTDLNAQAQYGAVLLAAEDDFSHEPAKPWDMPQAFYKRGLESASSSNLYAYYGGEDHIAALSIDAYMEDSDTSNLAEVGHRRWILNPPLKRIGLGQAASEEGWIYSVMQVVDESRAKVPDFNYVAYPANGAFPLEIFGPDYAWSVSLNEEKFQAPEGKKVTVTVVRQRDRKTWTLNSKYGKVAEKGNYFTVEPSGYGSGAAIIFRPGGILKYEDGDRYQVTIQGLRSQTGTARTLSYAVDFVRAIK
ncbi:CAP domain-containing protein [Cohnella cellulosilytica]|uniref:CAP domain-containing protein n=1 Tax=Cohnella cellulosilytica TaxID=986710 RepID=A0ABW2FEC4_9BACL